MVKSRFVFLLYCKIVANSLRPQHLSINYIPVIYAVVYSYFSYENNNNLLHLLPIENTAFQYQITNHTILKTLCCVFINNPTRTGILFSIRIYGHKLFYFRVLLPMWISRDPLEKKTDANAIYIFGVKAYLF